MTQIQETLCSVASRKDCSSRTTCQLRHSGEEVGKELQYYCGKFERKVDFKPSESPQDSSTYLPVSNFSKETVKGDGHCIINAVLFLLEKKGKGGISKKELYT